MALPIIAPVWCARPPPRCGSSSYRCRATAPTSGRSRPSGAGSGRTSPTTTAIPPPTISAAVSPLSRRASIRIAAPSPTASGSRISSIPKTRNYASQTRCGLGRQSRLARLPLQRGEVGGRVAAEAGSQGSRVTPAVETLAEISPTVLADAAQGAGGGRTQARRGGRDQPHLAAQHRRGRGRPAPGRAALVVPLRAEQLLEAVVGARQVRDGVAVEQPRPVAAGDLAEVLDRARQVARSGAMARHGPDQAVEAAPDHGGGLVCRVAQDVRRPVHPAVGPLDAWPEGGGALEAAADQPPQPRDRRRAAPFSATRSRLPATASSRALSFSPEAASGARPSSVMALRTAAQ